MFNPNPESLKQRSSQDDSGITVSESSPSTGSDLKEIRALAKEDIQENPEPGGSSVRRNTAEDLQEMRRFTIENNRMLRKVIRYNRWQAVFGFLKMTIIVAPIVLAYLYLPKSFVPQMRETFVSVISMFQNLQKSQDQLQQIDINGIDLEGLQNMLKQKEK